MRTRRRRAGRPDRVFPQFLLGTLLLCAALLLPALLAASLAATVRLSVKRSALLVMAGTAWLLAADVPARFWALEPTRHWRETLGARWARWGLIVVGVVALLLAAVVPLAWLRVLR
jgi:hypothetical protein